MGYEVIDDNNSIFECDVKHVALYKDTEGFVAETETDLGASVSYDVDLTPIVDDIQPRWGAVSGGT